MPVEARKDWVSRRDPLALTRQCELAGVARSAVYAPSLATKPDDQELALLALIDAEYTRHPFFGSRKMTVYLRGMGYRINRCWADAYDLIEMKSEEFRSAVEAGVKDKDKLTKNAIRFVKPAKRDPEAHIRFDDNTKLQINSGAVKAMPSYIIESESEEVVEDHVVLRS